VCTPYTGARNLPAAFQRSAFLEYGPRRCASSVLPAHPNGFCGTAPRVAEGLPSDIVMEVDEWSMPRLRDRSRRIRHPLPLCRGCRDWQRLVRLVATWANRVSQARAPAYQSSSCCGVIPVRLRGIGAARLPWLVNAPASDHSRSYDELGEWVSPVDGDHLLAGVRRRDFSRSCAMERWAPKSETLGQSRRALPEMVWSPLRPDQSLMFLIAGASPWHASSTAPLACLRGALK